VCAAKGVCAASQWAAHRRRERIGAEKMESKVSGDEKERDSSWEERAESDSTVGVSAEVAAS